MKAIIQHNFNSGLGDCIVAIAEYIENIKYLKNLGFSTTLKINTNENKYYSNLDLFDLIDKNLFVSYFDTIEYIQNTETSYFGFINKHISYGAKKPGMHWWDLFIDTDQNIPIITFDQNHYEFNNVKNSSIKINFTKNILDYTTKILSFNITSLYLRLKDYNDDINNISKTTLKYISDIYKQFNYVFICSNSYSIKEYIRSLYPEKTILLQSPLEKELGYHYSSNLSSNDRYSSKIRTHITLAEMFILSKSNQIFFHTEWDRISNFLFPSYVNRVPITVIP